MSEVLTVLIVEDEFAIADLLAMVLVDEGYRVLLASNGRQGIERLAETPDLNLVISDYMMPVLDGAGLIQAMLSNDTQRRIPYIIMSSMPEANVRDRIQGYAAFIRKPFQLSTMLQTVADILLGQQPGV